MNMKRRKFINDVVKAGIFVGATGTATNAFALGDQHSKYLIGLDQLPLPYAYAALEPMIDARTMEIHYTKHAAAYSTNLKDAVKAENVDPATPVEKILAGISTYSPKMRNNGGGHFNHELFWKCMKPNGGGLESSALGLLQGINSQFGSLDAMKTQFSDAAKTRFGSGWAWLYVDNKKQLKIGSTPNQDNPLMDVADIKGTPILGLDVWEHAYYLKYQNRRPEYIENWWKLVNWDHVQDLYQLAMK
jgi:Fe-Mn family superoxide dismutase